MLICSTWSWLSDMLTNAVDIACVYVFVCISKYVVILCSLVNSVVLFAHEKFDERDKQS